jgi:charged multivesicular body protein 3|eukprot:g14471.t1
MFVFGGRKLTPKEQQKKWKKDLRKQQRELDKQIRTQNRQQGKVKREIKKYAKSGDIKIVETLAKDIVRSNKLVERLYTAKAQINSVSMQLQNQVAMQTVTKAMGQSSQMMKSMQALVSLPDVRQAAMDMAREMEKAGLIQEMQDDMMEMMDPDDMDEAVKEEVDKVTIDIIGGIIDKDTNAIVPVNDITQANKGEDKVVEDMEARLKQLTS